MATRAERFRAQAERTGNAKRRPKSPPKPDQRAGQRARAALVAKHDHPGSRVPHNVAPRASKNSTYELEATNDASRPSRKSTRRSATHVKPDADMRLRAVNRTSSPKRRAARAR